MKKKPTNRSRCVNIQIISVSGKMDGGGEEGRERERDKVNL